jgi:S-adenosylmethionine decarboxylase
VIASYPEVTRLTLVRPRLHRPELQIEPLLMRLYVMDAWVSDPTVLVDREELRATLRAAARAGAARVVGEAFHVFPNGAVTGVLVLAQSHLSIHTWPELRLANVDLLSYGSVDGPRVLAVIRERLGAERANVELLERAGG